MTDKKFPWDPIGEARRQWAAHGWRSASGGMAVLTSVVRVQQILIARVELALKPFNISFARYEVLMLLYFSRSGELPMRKLGQRLQVHPTSVTNAIDRLEAAALVQRNPHPTDRRTILIRLTDEGRDLALRATEVINKSVFDDLGWSDEDMETLYEILAAMRRSNGDF